VSPVRPDLRAKVVSRAGSKIAMNPDPGGVFQFSGNRYRKECSRGLKASLMTERKGID